MHSTLVKHVTKRENIDIIVNAVYFYFYAVIVVVVFVRKLNFYLDENRLV